MYEWVRPDPEDEDTWEKHFQGGVALKETLCRDSAQGALTALQPARVDVRDTRTGGYGRHLAEQRRRWANQQPAVWVLQRQRIAYLEALLRRAGTAREASEQRACSVIACAADQAREWSCELERCAKRAADLEAAVEYLSFQYDKRHPQGSHRRQLGASHSISPMQIGSSGSGRPWACHGKYNDCLLGHADSSASTQAPAWQVALSDTGRHVRCDSNFNECSQFGSCNSTVAGNVHASLCAFTEAHIGRSVAVWGTNSEASERSSSAWDAEEDVLFEQATVEWHQLCQGGQMSGCHGEEPHLWYIQDTSTNGTCINGERVPKGTSRHLKEGDRIKLAALTEDPDKIVQYIFTRVTGSRTASPNKEAASRKRAFEESGPSNASNKRMSPVQAVAPVDAAILKKLRTSNDDLRMKLQKERQATQAAEAKAEEAEAKMREAQAAVAQSADAALAQAKAELVAVKGEMCLQAAALAAAQQEVETHKRDLQVASLKLEGLQTQVQQQRADKDELSKKMKSTEGELMQVQNDRRRLEYAQNLAEERAQAAFEAKQAAEQACIGAHSLQQEAERNLRTISQKLQEVEDAKGAAEEKAACLEALLQQYAAKLTEVREAEAEQEAAAEDMVSTFQEAIGQLAAKRGQQGALLDALQRQLAAALTDTNPNTQATLQASPERSHRQTNGAHVEVTGTQQEQGQRQRLKGSSSEATHAQRSSCRSVTSGQAESAHEVAGVSDQAMLPGAEPEPDLNDMETQRAFPPEEGNEEPTVAQWRTKLPQIAEASSAECRGDQSPGTQHVSLVKLAFKDGQGTLGTPSLFPGSNGQLQLPSLLQNSTAAGSQERLQAVPAQPGSQRAGAEHETAHEDDDMADGSPTADRENLPDNHPAPRSHSRGKGAQAAGDAGSSLKLSLQSAGGQGGALTHAEEWNEME